MKWKILFLLFLVAVGFFLFLKREELNSSIFSPITGFFSQTTKIEGRSIVLTIESFNSPLSLKILNNTAVIEGVCTLPINIGKTIVQLTNKECRLEFYNPRGELTIEGNKLDFSFNSPTFRINEVMYSGEDKIVGSLIVRKGFLNVFSSKTEIENFKGNLQIMSYNNLPTIIVNFPACEYLKLDSFFGSLQIENNSLKLVGIAIGKYRCQNVENKV
ncbi:MAG: hypothetical protein QXD89_00490 [Candidatus Aenigmatarchaeota archaeon]